MIYSWTLGSGAFHSRGEGREAQVVKAMLAQNDMVLPLTSCGEISCKPPLFHWVAVIGSRLFGGQTEYTTRLPSMLAASLSIAFLWMFVAAHFGRRMAWSSAAILASSMLWMRNASHARVDMMLTFSLLVTLIALFYVLERWRRGESTAWGWLALAALGGTMSVLSKGPMGLVIPMVVCGFYVLLLLETPRWQHLFRLPLLPLFLGLGSALALGGIWYWLAWQSGGDRFFTVHVVNENLARFIEVPDFKAGHIKPFYYSFIYLFAGFVPWCLLIPMAALVLFRQRKMLRAPEQSAALFALCWFIVILVMVTVSSAKRSVYLMPGYPALALLLTWSLVHVSAEGIDRFARWALYAVLAVLGVALSLLVVVFFGGIDLVEGLAGRFGAAEDVQEVRWATDLLPAHPDALLLVAVAFGILVWGVWDLGRRPLRGWAVEKIAAGMLLVFLGGGRMMPAICEAQSPRSFCAEVEELVPADARLAMLHSLFFSTGFYLERDCEIVGDTNGLEIDDSLYLIATPQNVERHAPNASQHFEVLLTSHPRAANGKRTLQLLRGRKSR